MDKPTVGFIGLGVMGSRMARNVFKAGYPLVAYDLRKEATKDFIKMGAQAAETPREVAEKSTIIMMSLPNPDIVRNVVLGKNGVLEGAKKGSTLIEFSTIDPATMREIAEAGKQKGIDMLGAPVGGTSKEAEEGKLLIWISGNSECFKNCEDVLSKMGKSVYCGEDPGISKAIKLVNNLMAIGNLMVGIEAFALGTKMGVEPRFLFDVVNQTGARSASFQAKYPKVIDRSFNEVTFALTLATKDAKLAISMANENQVPVPIASSFFSMCMATVASGYGDEDLTSVAKLYEGWARG